MSTENIQRFEHSTDVKIIGMPYITVLSSGTCYLNNRAAKILNLKNLDTIALYHNTEKTEFYFVNDTECGAQTRKNSGMYRFCDSKAVRLLTQTLNISASKFSLILSNDTKQINGFNALQIKLRPFNVKEK